MSFSKSIPIFLILSFIIITPIFARDSHIIKFQSPNLFPKSLAWDPSSQHFVITSVRNPYLHSVSDAGIVTTLLTDDSLSPDASFLGVSVDKYNQRLLAVVQSDPSNTALAAYDLKFPHRRIFLTTFQDSGAIDVAVDFSGNAFVTDSVSNIIWKVDKEGEQSVFSKVDASDYSSSGLYGVVYINKGYLLVTQSNTGKLYKVDEENGSARRVLLNKDLTAPTGIAVRSDGVIVVVSQHKLYFIKSDNSWAEGVVFDETALDGDKFATSVTVGGGDRVYVLYGYLGEGRMGNVEKEEYSIVEIESEKESGEDKIWVYVLIGLGLAYFMFWRFQMKQLATNMNKKHA